MAILTKVTKLLITSILLALLVPQILLAGEQTPSISLSTSSTTVVFGTSINLTGKVTPAHTDENVAIYKTPVGGSKELITNVNQSSTGTFSYTVRPFKNTVYQAVYIHNGTTVSASKKVLVRPKIVVHASKSSIYVGEPVMVTATVVPSRPGRAAVIEQLVSGSWKAVKSGNLNSSSKISFSFTPNIANRYYFRARYIAETQYAGNWSSKISVLANKPFAVAHSQYTKFPKYGFAQKDTHSARVEVVRSALIEEFGPYSTKVITDSGTANLATLRKYRVVVFPAVTCVSLAQREAIRAYVREGGRILVSFGLARNDYDGYPLIWRYQFNSSWDLSRFWEWGEVSEIFQQKFNNDPLMSPGYAVNSGASTHPIIANTKRQLGITGPINMKSVFGGYNELNWTMKNNPNVTPILSYNTKNNGTTADDSSHGYGAAWVSRYYSGLSVYYTFMFQDFFWSGHKDAGNGNNLKIAKTLFINSIKWLRDTSAKGTMVKATNPTASTWLSGSSSGYSMNIRQLVSNSGNIQLRGQYFAEVYRSGSQIWRGTTPQPVPLGPGTSWTYNAWRLYIGKPAATNYTVRVGSYMFDAARGGLVRSYRDYVYKYSSGSLSLISVGKIVVSK